MARQTHYQMESESVWKDINRLIEKGQYERAAEYLHRAYIECERAGNLPTAEILVAARQICLACSRSDEEIVWHQRAREEAVGRKDELKTQLHHLLGQLAKGESGNQQTIGRSSLPDLPNVDDETAGLLEIYCLGPFRVFRDRRLIGNWHSLKGQSVFKYLIKHHRAPIAKEILTDVFWSDADPEVARRNLHQAIYSLRQTLKRGRPDFQPIQFENDCYSINPKIHLWLDFEEFECRAQTGRSLEAAGQRQEAIAEYALAVDLYLGDFLEEDPYEDWTGTHREQTRNLYFDTADRLSEHYRQEGNYVAAIDLCQKIIVMDKCNECAHRRLMLCYDSQGQRGLVARQFHFCVEVLRKELDVTPSVETLSLFEKIIGYGKGLSSIIRHNP